MKKCSKCQIEKDESEFNRRKESKDGLRNECKLCKGKRQKQYDLLNKDKICKQRKQYRELNKEKISESNKKWYENNKEKVAEYKHQNYTNNKESILDKSHAYYKNNKQIILEKKKKYYHVKIKQNKFKFTKRLRTRLTIAIRNNYKSGSAIKLLGCSIDELLKFLELKFYTRNGTKEKMSWDNYGVHGWHIDHIKPLSSFDLSDAEQLKQACHYTNLQPLWAEENLKKSNKLPPDNIN